MTGKRVPFKHIHRLFIDSPLPLPRLHIHNSFIELIESERLTMIAQQVKLHNHKARRLKWKRVLSCKLSGVSAKSKSLVFSTDKKSFFAFAFNERR